MAEGKISREPRIEREFAALDERLTNLERLNRPVYGVATLTWKAASKNSDNLTVTHGLGRTPKVVLVTSLAAPSFGKIPLCNPGSFTATTFTMNAELVEGHTGTITVSWLAI